MKYHNIPTLFDNQASLINGKNIGTDSVRYIQDAGQKTAGTTYIDRNTNELYVCVTTTNSVNNDGNFSKFNLKEAFNKLDNLFTFKRIMNKKAASGKLQMLDNYTKYRFLIFYAELDGNDSTMAHTYFLPVNTNFTQMASINQWGSSNANAVEVLLNPYTNEIQIFKSQGGSIIAIDAFR